MAIDKLTEDLNFVSALDNEPTESAEDLKRTFDKSGNLIKEYINEKLIPQMEEEYFKKTGGEIKGDITTKNVAPKESEVNDLGNETYRYRTVYANALKQKVPQYVGDPNISDHSFAFAYTPNNTIRLAIDDDTKKKYIPISNEHEMLFQWDGNNLILHIDGNEIGKIAFK